MGEGVAVQKLDGPLQETKQTADNAEQHTSEETFNASSTRCLTACNRANLSKELDNGDEQTAESNGPVAVGESALQCTTSGSLGKIGRVKVPRSVHARNGGVDGVLEPLGDPVHGKGDVGDYPNDLSLATASTCLAAGLVVFRRHPFGVHCDESD